MIQIDNRTGLIVSGSLAVLVMAFIIIAFIDNAQVIARRDAGAPRRLRAEDVVPPREELDPVPLEPPPSEPSPEVTGHLEVTSEPPAVLQIPLSTGQTYVLNVPEWMEVSYTTPPPAGMEIGPWQNMARDLRYRVALNESNDVTPDPDDPGAPDGMMHIRKGTSMPVEVKWQHAFLAPSPSDTGPGQPGSQVPGEGWTTRSIQRFYAEHYLRCFIGMYRSELSDRTTRTGGPGMALPEDLRAYFFGDYYTGGWYRMTNAEKIARGWYPPVSVREVWVSTTLGGEPYQFRDGTSTSLRTPSSVHQYRELRTVYRDSDEDGYYYRTLYMEDGHGLHFAQGARYQSRDSGNLDVTGARIMDALAIYWGCVDPWSQAYYNATETTLTRFIEVEDLWNQVYWLGARARMSLRDMWLSLGLPVFGFLDDYGDVYARRRELGRMW